MHIIAAKAVAFGEALRPEFKSYAGQIILNAKKLAETLESKGIKVISEAIPISGYALDAAAGSVDLIVNCTSLGMSHSSGENASPLSAAQIPATAIVNDLVYTPMLTPMLREASKAGATALGGLHMLIYQGVLSFKLWTGQDPPVDLMLTAATREMVSRGA